MNILNYIKQGSDSSDSLKFVRIDSTQAIKKDLTFSRKAGNFQPRIGTFSVPEYRAIFRNDVPTPDGLPSGQRLSIDLSIRMPVAATAAQLSELVTSLKELVNNEGFEAAVIQQTFPCETVCA